jgi:hypothetical protein
MIDIGCYYKPKRPYIQTVTLESNYAVEGLPLEYRELDVNTFPSKHRLLRHYNHDDGEDLLVSLKGGNIEVYKTPFMNHTVVMQKNPDTDKFDTVTNLDKVKGILNSNKVVNALRRRYDLS